VIPDPYNSIVDKRYDQFLKDKIDDEKLKKYFDSCFGDVFSYYGWYACWVCVKCMENKKFTYGWGKKPDLCPKCGKKSTYSVATFQAWASKSGDTFEWAFYKLIKEISDLEITPMPRQKDTHDFEITNKIAIEAKGSAEYIINPDGTKYHLDMPGMKRSDTEKKAFANGEKYKSQHPSNKFFIVTNAVLDGLTIEGRAADGVFDVTKKVDLDKFLEECKKHRGRSLESF
jgi:hypothetical protein